MSSTESKTKAKNKTIGNILKWVLIIGLLIFACVKNKSFMAEAIYEIRHTSLVVVVVCVVLSNLYFVAEGRIISRMTSSCESGLSLWQGMKCAYMCAFYKLATFGSGTGIAQVYFYNTRGIPVAEGTGMGLAQYTFQKITIGVMGVISFICLVIIGNRQLLKYSGYMLAGVVVISFICLFLFVITVSKKISDLVMKLARKIVKEKWKLHNKLDDAQNAIDNLQHQGKLIWNDKSLFLQVVLLNIIKFGCWYAIPGVIFFQNYDVNILMCLALMSVCNMLGCVMVAPAGIGTTDFVFAMFFSAIIPEADLVAAALVIYRFFTWIVPFIIGIIPAVLVKRHV